MMSQFLLHGGNVINSIRHYFVTQRWKAGVQLRDIANSCGTSVNQIEKTYYHIDEEKMIETAVMDKRRAIKI